MPGLGAAELAAALSGLMAAQAFAPLDLAIMGWLALIPLLAALRRATPRQGAWRGFLQGGVFYLLLLSWIPGVVSGYGGMGPPASWMVGLLLAATLAAFHALFGAVQAWLFCRLGTSALMVAPAGWVVLAEWARTWPLGGFPWGFLGYSQHGSTRVLALAPWLGVHGLSFMLVGFAALVVAIFSSRLLSLAWRVPALSALVALPFLILGIPAGVPAPEEGGDDPLQVVAVQGNVPQEDKWQQARHSEIMERHLAMTRKALEGGARLVVWPESSTVEQIARSPELQHRLRGLLGPHQARALVGSVYSLPAGGYTNAAFLVDPVDGLAERYDKMHLVPFGETVPLRDLLFFIEPMVEAVGDFQPGRVPGVLGRDLDLRNGQVTSGQGRQGTPFGVAICYEVIYAHMVAEQVRQGATFLTTITNDAWFGRTAAPAQHFAMAVVRAAETRRWLLRAANTGISGLVAPDGRVVAASELFTTAMIQGSITPRHDLTFFVRHPHALVMGCVMILLLAAVLAAVWNPHGGF
jgi:apolipoprotein N-acyltransferase